MEDSVGQQREMPPPLPPAADRQETLCVDCELSCHPVLHARRLMGQRRQSALRYDK